MNVFKLTCTELQARGKKGKTLAVVGNSKDECLVTGLLISLTTGKFTYGETVCCKGRVWTIVFHKLLKSDFPDHTMATLVIRQCDQYPPDRKSFSVNL
jgi:hypothetical protein